MSKYATYFAIEKKARENGFQEERAEFIDQFTNGKKQSLSALTGMEYKEFCKWLNNVTAPAKEFDPNWMNTPENTMRRKMISLFVHQMGYTLEGLNEWCKDYGKFKKDLKSHSYKELVDLVSQGEKVYLSYLKHV